MHNGHRRCVKPSAPGVGCTSIHQCGAAGLPNLPMAVNTRGTGAGDGLQAKLREGSPGAFTALATLVKEDPGARGRAVDGVPTASALLGHCGTLLGDDAREKARAALLFLATLSSPPAPGAAQRLDKRQHAALLGHVATARSDCAQHHVVRRAIVAATDELAAGRTVKIRSQHSVTLITLQLITHLSRPGAQDARDAVARCDAIEPFLAGVRTHACDGSLPRAWRECVLSSCDDLEAAYHMCRRDSTMERSAYTRLAEQRQYWALAVEARAQLHAFTKTKGRAELGAQKAAADVATALHRIARDIREDTKAELAADEDSRAKASELRRLGKRGAGFSVDQARASRRDARARHAARAGCGAVATAALQRFSQLNKGRLARGELDETRRSVREAACDVYAALGPLGDFGDSEDAAQAGPLLLAMLEDCASRASLERRRMQGGAGAWSALEAWSSGAVSSEPRLRLIQALRLDSARLADLAAASLVGDGGPRDVAPEAEAQSCLRVVAALVPSGADELTGPTALRLAYACEAHASGPLVGLAIRVLLAVAQRATGPARDLLERRADALDADADEPYYQACGMVRRADDVQSLTKALDSLREAAPSTPGSALAAAGAAGLLLDVLRSAADAKATTAIRALDAVGAVASASYACRLLLAAQGAPDAVRLAEKYENVPGVAAAAINCLAALFSVSDSENAHGFCRVASEVDGEVLDRAVDMEEDEDPELRRFVRETSVVIAATTCAPFVVAYASRAPQKAQASFGGGVSNTKALADAAQASGLRCLGALLATRDRASPFADAGSPTQSRTLLRRYRARRAAHAAARSLLTRELKGAAALVGDFLEQAKENIALPTDAALVAFKRCHPRDVWRGDIYRGVEVSAWLADKRGRLGEDALILTVSCCWDAQHHLPPGCAATFVRIAESGREGLERAAPALETLYGKEADGNAGRGFRSSRKENISAVERQQGLLAAARNALATAPSPSKALSPQPQLSDGRAWLPFSRPARPVSPIHVEDSFFRPSSASSARSSLYSRGSTADGIRLLVSHAERIAPPAPPRSPLSRRLHSLPRRAPRKVQVNVPLPIRRIAKQRRRERERHDAERDERSRAAAKLLKQHLTSSELPTLRPARLAKAPVDGFANKLRRANERLGDLNDRESRQLRARLGVSTAGRGVGRDLAADAAGGMNAGFRAAVAAHKREKREKRGALVRVAGGDTSKFVVVRIIAL